ncbi:MAG: dienelactone hydrolase family protein [Bauldia sp.]|nr:dienelactone hydrolase family protein [Bauldia sp.]
MPTYADLGPYSDLVDACRALGPVFPETFVTTDEVRATLRFTVGDEQPGEATTADRWEADGVEGEEVTWSVGYGPPTRALLLKPAGAKGQLPGIVALYDHGHFKLYGKEKIADGRGGPVAAVRPFRETYYGGRAFANDYARAGFAVLVHDTFLWGARKFPLEAMPEMDRDLADSVGAALGHGAIAPEVLRYNGAAYLHEHQIAKYCGLLGTSYAAVTAYEDRVALNYLAGRDDVDSARIGCVGFSGGGLRAALLGATADNLAARVVAGMMSTYEPMLSRHVVPHNWMLFTGGWGQIGDFPGIAACAAPKPLLVNYALGDEMFPEAGMRDADAMIRRHYDRAGVPGAYTAAFHDGPHRFDRPMQGEALVWLRSQLG